VHQIDEQLGHNEQCVKRRLDIPRVPDATYHILWSKEYNVIFQKECNIAQGCSVCLRFWGVVGAVVAEAAEIVASDENGQKFPL
jgi:hypothetical protein